MRSIFSLIFATALFFSGVGLVSAESISEFSVRYEILPDSNVEVTETITYDFENEDRHGIFRIINKHHPQGASVWYKTRFIDITDVVVARNGRAEPFTLTDSRSSLEIKIGDADSTVTGKHIYQISYILHGALSYGEDGAEFYFNATGNEWLTQIATATALISSPALGGNVSCYQGVVGSSHDCASFEVEEGQVLFNAANISPGEGLTVAAELVPEKVALVSTERINFLPFGYVLAVIWIFYLGYLAYRFRRGAKTHLPIIAQYEPYENYLPMYTGVLSDQQLDPRDITAGIIYLAEQGFLKITKTTRKVLLVISVDDYDITLLRPVSEISSQFLRELCQLIFAVDALPQTVVPLSSLVTQKTKNTTLILKLKADLKADLATSGFTTTSKPVLSNLQKLLITLVYVFFVGFIFVPAGFLITILVGVASLVVVIFIFVPRRTAKGYEALNHIEGFKLFLSVTDKERFDFHNAPEKSPEQFMKYLPYAVALGVEEKWAKVFEDITIPQPDWYDGGNIGAFSAVALTNDVAVFSSSFSSSSGTSGSSGGGSSGGGGGGGGGGSW